LNQEKFEMSQQALTGTNCQAKPISDEFDFRQAREELRQDFYETALWRRKLVSRFPEDQRNDIAAQILDRLVGSVEAVPELLLLQFEQIVDNLPTDEELDAALRAIAFRTFPASAVEFVSGFIAKHKIAGK
jgi:hypothetical protein